MAIEALRQALVRLNRARPKEDKLIFTNLEIYRFILAAAAFGKQLLRLSGYPELKREAGEFLQWEELRCVAFPDGFGLPVRHKIRLKARGAPDSEEVTYPLFTRNHLDVCRSSPAEMAVIEGPKNAVGRFLLFHCTIAPAIEDSIHSEQLAEAFKVAFPLTSTAVFGAARALYDSVKGRRGEEGMLPSEIPAGVVTGADSGSSGGVAAGVDAGRGVGRQAWVHAADEEPPEGFYREDSLRGTQRELSMSFHTKSSNPNRKRLRTKAEKEFVWVKEHSAQDYEVFFKTQKLLEEARERLNKWKADQEGSAG